MMKLQDQVCSQSLSLKLCELGVTQESMWSWSTKVVTASEEVVGEMGIMRSLHKNWPDAGTVTSAFTVAELGKVLGDGFGSMINSYQSTCAWHAIYNPITEKYNLVTGSTEADARAELVIILIEKEKFKVENIKI